MGKKVLQELMVLFLDLTVRVKKKRVNSVLICKFNFLNHVKKAIHLHDTGFYVVQYIASILASELQPLFCI